MDRIADKYDVVRELGVGSYGRVYLVTHAFLGVSYALKILTRQLSDNEHFIERFKQEAQILAKFNHPGSVQLRDFGRTAEGLFYMATDFCEGVPLAAYLDAHAPLPVELALDIMEQILIVLEAAHHFGIIHRDVKPENIMALERPDGSVQIKILDFGVAKIKEHLTANSKATTEGVTIGTPFYMSPEQAAGQADVDHRADLYSAGIVLYELLSGDVPFRGESVIQTLLMHITCPASSVADRLRLPKFFDEMLFRALAKDRVYRYQDAADFLGDVLRARRMAREISRSEVVAPEAVTLEATPGLAVVAPEQTRILCLDDNEMILQILKYILEGQGFQVFTATNFSVIHPYLFTHGADLMLCDVQMPGLPGTKVCQMLKESKKDLKIVLFSNINDRELEKLSLECHADDWLSKNKRPEDWLEKIREVIARPAPFNQEP